MSISWIRNKFSCLDNYKTDNHFDVNIIPENVWIGVFFNLSSQELFSCSRVSHRWNQICENGLVWRSILSLQPDIIDDFLPLIKKNLCSWKDAYCYSPLSLLLNQAFKFTFYEYYSKKYNNYFNFFEMKTSNQETLVKHGQFKFVVSESLKVMMLDVDNQEIGVFDSNQDSIITNLQVDGEFLFALNKEGYILQWNIKTKAFIKKIETCYSENDIRLNSSRDVCYLRGICDNFFVKNGYAILIYPCPSALIEVIPYQKIETKIAVRNENFFRCRPLCIKEKNLYIAGQHTIMILDLLNVEPIKTHCVRQGQYNLKAIAVGKNNFFSTSYDFEKKILKHDKITGKEMESISCEPEINNSFIYMELIGHLLFCFSNQSKIVIFNTLSGDHIKTIINIFNFDTQNINLSILEELVNICEENKPLISDELVLESAEKVTERIQTLFDYLGFVDPSFIPR